MTKSAKLISLLFPIGILLSFSLTILGSINQIYLTQQAISILIASFIFLLVFLLDYHFYIIFPWILYGSSLLSLLLTYVFGSLSRGSVRWIDLGFIRFQPSEFVKPLLIVFFSIAMSRIIDTPLKYIKILLLTLPPLLFIFFQPDLGSTLILFGVFASQLLASSIPRRYLWLTLVTIIILSPLIWSLLKPYQRERVAAFVAPQEDPLGSGYNAIQAIISVGSGQIVGRGLGQGTQSQLKFLPERQTDFIFATISEEFGLLGSLTIVGVYIWLLASLIHFASTANDEVGRLICVGTFFLIIIQAFVNIGMNIGLLPITGITLPMVSLGGSSLISMAMILGVVANIQEVHARNRPTLEIK